MIRIQFTQNPHQPNGNFITYPYIKGMCFMQIVHDEQIEKKSLYVAVHNHHQNSRRSGKNMSILPKQTHFGPDEDVWLPLKCKNDEGGWHPCRCGPDAHEHASACKSCEVCVEILRNET